MNVGLTRPGRKVGRPLSFEREPALRKAMLVFWQHGYESTSLHQLTRAMGVTAPSIYAAFGDKQRLFMQAVELYTAGPINSQSLIDASPTARAAAEALLSAAVIGFTGPGTPSGCLLATSAISCSPEAAGVQRKLAAIRRGVESSLTARIARGISEQEFSNQVDPKDLAAYVMTVIQGLSTLARDGASRAKLHRVANLAISAWPL